MKAHKSRPKQTQSVELEWVESEIMIGYDAERDHILFTHIPSGTVLKDHDCSVNDEIQAESESIS